MIGPATCPRLEFGIPFHGARQRTTRRGHVDRFLLLRSDDQLLLGVAWSGLSYVGRDASGTPILGAGPDALIVLTLPPQHVGELWPQMFASSSPMRWCRWRCTMSRPAGRTAP